ncbi:MAG: ATP-dependent DNA helicase RecG [Syntrophales bacterium]
MESLKNIVEKMAAPLFFAQEYASDRPSLVRDLETVMTSLAQRILSRARHAVPPPQRAEVINIARQLVKLFNGYDGKPQEYKKRCLAEAAGYVAGLKTIVTDMPVNPPGRTSAVMTPSGEGGSDTLSRPVDAVRGVGPRLSELFARKGIHTIEDLLYFFPRRYEDRRIVRPIGELLPGTRQTVAGRITRSDIRYYGQRRIFEITVDDGHGVLKAKWFKGRVSFLKGACSVGQRVILTGEVRGGPFEKEMIHPDHEILADDEDQLLNFKRIVPVYSETEGLHQKTIRRIIWQVTRDYAHLLGNCIPEEISRRRRLMDICEAVRQVHFPENEQDFRACTEWRSEGHRTLIYDEVFYFQLGCAIRNRGGMVADAVSFRTAGEMKRKFCTLLPFSLTMAQQRVIAEIEGDMAARRPMNRLLQGDVGSGKTLVSLAAMLTCCENGYQSVLMAPTEILAEQHFRKVRSWTGEIGVRVELLTGGLKAGGKRDLLARLSRGEIDIVVGTHALIQEGVAFKNLGLVVVDEQHRFGVGQRAALRKKGASPDLLVMTATPIPRTLAMTVYGDLDVSIIDELPPGRKTVRTKVFFESQRNRVYEIVRREVKRGNQVFIVYPVIEDCAMLDIRGAARMAKHLQQKVFPDCRIGLIHGRLKAAEKDRIMADYAGKNVQILVATTVIEVGIDIPEASLMVVEHAERFGLSQLHQLRGRVGRSDVPSYCILLSSPDSSDTAAKRLRVMEETDDGFRIAEEDLAIRGPGELWGTRQTGLPDFRIADLLRDGRILAEAKGDAFALVQEDPRLERPEHVRMQQELLRRMKGKLELGRTG